MESYDKALAQLREAIRGCRHLCVFTGAGISCPSGIPDFRSADGLYHQQGRIGYTPEQIISHSFFTAHTGEFYEFYRDKMLYPDALPNAAHRYFAALEQSGKRVSVVTQNIDGLHQAAGSKEVYELHGSVHRNRCTRCGRRFDMAYIAKSHGIPRCPDDDAVIKPEVVLYEESLDDTVVDGAIRAISDADVMLVIGTSLAVYPAAAYVQCFRGDLLALINRSATGYDAQADLVFHEDIIRVVAGLLGDEQN